MASFPDNCSELSAEWSMGHNCRRQSDPWQRTFKSRLFIPAHIFQLLKRPSQRQYFPETLLRETVLKMVAFISRINDCKCILWCLLSFWLCCLLCFVLFWFLEGSLLLCFRESLHDCRLLDLAVQVIILNWHYHIYYSLMYLYHSCWIFRILLQYQ